MEGSSAFDRLPDEVIVAGILLRLAPRDALTLGATDSRMHALASDRAIWRSFCVRDLDLSVPTAAKTMAGGVEDWMAFYRARMASTPRRLDIDQMISYSACTSCSPPTRISIVGRRSTGKTTLLRLLHEKIRCLVGARGVFVADEPLILFDEERGHKGPAVVSIQTMQYPRYCINGRNPPDLILFDRYWTRYMDPNLFDELFGVLAPTWSVADLHHWGHLLHPFEWLCFGPNKRPFVFRHALTSPIPTAPVLGRDSVWTDKEGLTAEIIRQHGV